MRVLRWIDVLGRAGAHLTGRTKPSGTRCSGFACRSPDSQVYKPTWVDSPVASLDIQMGCAVPASNWSALEDGDLAMPAGNERVVTADTVSELCGEGRLTEAVEALGVLVQTDRWISTSLVYTVLKKCVVNKALVLGRCVHACTVKTGYESDTFLCNHVLRMYVAHGRLREAMDVFTIVAEPDAFMWSSIISAHVHHGEAREAIELYHRMRKSSVKPDGHVFVAALQACSREADLQAGKQVHGDVLATGVEPDLYVCSSLVDMYAKCGSLEDAKHVFDGLGKKTVVTWNAMIGGCSQQGMSQEAFDLYNAMREEGMAVPDSVTFACLLQACANLGRPAIGKGRQLHARIRECGYVDDVVVANSLVNMYAKCGSLEDAQRVFDGLGEKSVVTWNAMIGGYSLQGMGLEALRLYSAMEEEGLVEDSVTYVILLRACTSFSTPSLEMGKRLHARIREAGVSADEFVASSLVHMYAECGSLEDARDVFDALGTKNVVTWSSMIAGYSRQGMGQEALNLYRAMQEDGLAAPDSVTFVSLLQACVCVGASALEMGKHIHTQIRKRELQTHLFVANSLVNMYAKCGSLEDAQSVFDGLPTKDVVTWNAVIGGYSQQGMGREALRLYDKMRKEGTVTPDAVTFVCMFQACASMGTPALEKGKDLHAQIREQGLQWDVSVANSVVNMYAKCGSLDCAQAVFDRLPQKDVVTWNALIAGYSQQGMGQDALGLYSAMQRESMATPNALTFVSLLQSCANLAALHLGRQLHVQIKQQGLQADALVAGSLMDMYGKCGSMVDAQQVFGALPQRDTVAWNALIAGHSRLGDSEAVFDLLRRMRENCVQPDGITFLHVLTVCSHAGLVTQGREYFESMSINYGIAPTSDHYTCMVDLLGRAGRLDEALALGTIVPGMHDCAVWHTLLAACQKWNNVEMGRHAFDQAVKLDQADAAAYVLMSNIYTGAQMWEQAQEMQTQRKRIGAWKQAGQSWWTDAEGLVHSFTVGHTMRRPLKEKGGVVESAQPNITLSKQKAASEDRLL